MVHVQRLISTMIATTCAVTLLNLSSSIMGQEDISHNLIRDPVELGNPYQSTHGRGDNVMKRIKHSNSYRRPTPPIPSSTAFSTSGEDSSTGTVLQGVEGHETGHHDQPNSQSQEADCPLCTAARQNARLDEDTLRSVRVEMVKRQILKKLRLKEPPKMENVPKGHHTILPPIAFGNSVSSNAVRGENEEDDVSSIDLEDYYGKTEQIIVLPQDEVGDCARWPNENRGSRSEASSCFVFNLPKEVGSNQISSAELWVYKLSDVSSELDESSPSQQEQNKTLTNQHHFSISEILSVPSHRSSRRRSSIHFSTIAVRSDIPESSAWVNFNITERARKWLVTDAPDHTIRISCSTCSRDVNEFPFDTTGEQLPFIVFNIANGKKKRRSRRSLNCSPGITECCRESLYISFAEIKWDWVIEPKGFNAFYCKGKCHGDTALANGATRHSGIMIDYVKSQGGVNNRTAELIPCCTATEMKPISLLYMDSNTTLQQVLLPNMVVKSCGCK